ncbi:MAG TPA: GNAT family N-acetyltransferase [Thermoanaerobaculia bacterium]|nr:GNAT family N-acetyltransferase [Thermoanaerobaculia bacterium]
MQAEVTTWHLEMLSPADLRPSGAEVPGLEIRQARIPSPELNRFLYTAVGGDWFWIDRLCWTYEDWLRYLDRPEVETWVAYLEGTPAGYCELERQPGAAGDDVEILYFGLLPRFIGRGLGGRLLTRAVERAWEMGASRVWVHTCSLDGPAALPAYRARGFRVFKEVRSEQAVPAEPPGPWPGARDARMPRG